MTQYVMLNMACSPVILLLGRDDCTIGLAIGRWSSRNSPFFETLLMPIPLGNRYVDAEVALLYPQDRGSICRSRQLLHW